MSIPLVVEDRKRGEALLEVLRLLGSDPTYYPTHCPKEILDLSDNNVGICYLADRILRNYDTDLEDFFHAWPKFSGCKVYPVPAVEELDEEDEYDNNENKWGESYGELRRDLAKFIAENAEIEVYD